MIINLDSEKPENISQEVWENMKKVFNDIFDDESEVSE